MSVAQPAILIDSIRTARLLDDSQLAELEQLAKRQPGRLAAELVRRGWLTGWQLEVIGQGEASKLAFGSYVLLDRLGKGGMGEVYKARQRRLKRLVALKVIHPNLLADPDTVQRFHREAEAAARLDHPNIVRIYDADEVGGVHFLAMEYVDGADLGKLIKQSGALPAGQACDLVRQTALGLQHAHEQGLVHRDIKPGNLILSHAQGSQSAGVIKILDLGLARLERTTNIDEIALTLTQANTPLGTPAYWAPEQAMNAHGADIRADIYSLGCTLYHLLAGRPPFMGRDLAQMVVMHLTLEPEPVETEKQLPKGLPDFVRKMMAKRPEERPQTPGDVAKGLERWAKAGPPAKPAEHHAKALATPASLPATAKPSATVANALRGPEQKTPARPRRGGWLVVALLLAAVVASVAVLAPERFKEGTDWVLGLVGRSESAGITKTKSFAQGEPKLPVTKVDPPTANSEPPIVNPPEIKPPDNRPPEVKPPQLEPIKPSPRPTKPQLLGAPFSAAQAKEAQKVWAEYLGRKVEEKVDLGGGVTMEFVLIPPGVFTMGSPKGEKDRRDDEDEHKVEITKPFYLGKYAVTQEQIEKLTGGNPSWFSTDGKGQGKVRGQATGRFPVEAVSWDDAVEFCKYLKDRQGSGRFELPTEAEWEYACRAGTSTPFHFGSVLDGRLANCNGHFPYGTTEEGPNLARTCAVGSYQANAFGLYDMHGNVSEWCADWYGAYDQNNRKDQRGPDSGQFRVVRGGSWRDLARYCRAAHRDWVAPGNRYFNVGFRAAFHPD